MRPALRNHTSISIHALREEGDLEGCVKIVPLLISIHALREEGDPVASTPSCAPSVFLSTPSARRATASLHKGKQKGTISIHALREEGDQDGLDRLCCRSYFYPRPPRGGRQMDCIQLSLFGNFYPRPPRGGRRTCPRSTRRRTSFLSTPSARRATQGH